MMIDPYHRVWSAVTPSVSRIGRRIGLPDNVGGGTEVVGGLLPAEERPRSAFAMHTEHDLTQGPLDICSAAYVHVEQEPNKPFYVFVKGGAKVEYSFAQLWRDSGKFAAALVERGVRPGSVVVVSMPTGPNLIASFLGALRAGLIPSIMPYPNIKQKEAIFWSTHQALFDRIDPGCFVVSAEIAALYAANLAAFSPRILNADDVCAADFPVAAIAPDEIAFLQHSSGTTALKKGVRLTHRSVVDHVRKYADQCGIDEWSRLFSWLPLYHDMGLISCFIMPLVVGATVTVMDNFEWVARPAAMLKAISEDRLEFAWMPNFGFAHLVRSCPDPSQFELASVKALINCSEPCHPETHAAFLEHFAKAGLAPSGLQVCYGMAENVFAVTQTDFACPAGELAISARAFSEGRIVLAQGDEAVLAVASCGTALAGTDVSIVDGNRMPLADWELGEVAIRSSHLFVGYNGRSDLTDKVLVDGVYYSGDLGFRANGELFLTGRKDDLIIAYGRNFLAHEIESSISQLPGIKPGRVVVFDMYSAHLGTNALIVMAEVLPDADRAIVAKSIRHSLDASSAISPHDVVLLSQGELIKTTSGKISRPGNRTAYLNRQKGGHV